VHTAPNAAIRFPTFTPRHNHGPQPARWDAFVSECPVDLRAKLARQAVPFLEPGEQIHAVFRAQTCFCIREAIAARCPLWHMIAVTDRAVLVLDLSLWTCRPTRVRLRHGRGVYFGWSRSFTLDNQKVWVVRGFDEDVAAADAALVEIMRRRNIGEIGLVSHDGATMRPVPPPSWH
jgi:hypothetical protein